jgi:hypothetical protein
MKMYANARLSLKGRELLMTRVLDAVAAERGRRRDRDQ